MKKFEFELQDMLVALGGVCQVTACAWLQQIDPKPQLLSPG